MSEAESTRQADPDLEKKRQEIAEEFEILGQVYDGVLWTPEMDFTQLCSCHDCLKKIESLNEFEKELTAKTILVSSSVADLEDKELLCINIFFSVDATKGILEFLENKLKAVCEKSGVTLENSGSIDELNKMFKTIAKSLRGVGFFGGPGDTDSDNDDSATNDDDKEDLFAKIDNVRFCYRNTKAKDEVYGFLEEIINLENDWVEDDNETAEKLKLENQIKKVNEFPVDKLQSELDELIPQMREKEYRSKMSSKAMDCIHHTCYRCIRKGKDFWKRSPLPTKSNEHSSNGLEETLDALNKEVDLFKMKWKNEFAHVFTPNDRSDPKRRLVE